MKSREHVTTNGRAVFYACMWDDFRQAAMNCGWALGLHGSLASDMDIMAMPWVEDASPVEDMIAALESCLTIPEDSITPNTRITTDKPNGRVVYTIHIFADFYIDLNIISTKQLNKENGSFKPDTWALGPTFSTSNDMQPGTWNPNIENAGESVDYNRLWKGKFQWTNEKIMTTIQMLTDYFERFGPGEVIMQSDDGQLLAPELLADIADDVLQIK
jgi:hypothetical protein